jgi:hypothetical protein
MPRLFNCPECGGHAFGTSLADPDALTAALDGKSLIPRVRSKADAESIKAAFEAHARGYCHGWKGKHTRCLFTWKRSDDAKYFTGTEDTTTTLLASRPANDNLSARFVPVR